MKHLYLLSVIAFVTICSSCGSSQSNSSSRLEAPERQGWNEQRPLFGDVESVTITYYWLNDKFGEIVRDSIYRLQKYYFNEEGDVIKSNDFNFMNKYTYDSARNITEEARYRPDGSLAWKEIYKYDSAGNRTEVVHYKSDGSLCWKGVYKYDSARNRNEEAYYFLDGSLAWKEINKYDSAGNKTEAARYDSDGSLGVKTVYKYDSAGNKTEEAQYGSGGWSVWLQMLIYESNSTENRFEWNSDGSLSWKSIYKYDSRGNMIEETYYDSDGSLAWKEINKYDSAGNRTEVARYDSDGSLNGKYTYKYDSRGNMIEETDYSSGALIPKSQSVFEIVYRN